MWERATAIVFVIFFPLLYITLWNLHFKHYTVNKYIYYISLTVQSTVLSSLIGIWIHFLPCFWLYCDGSNKDNIQFRGILLVVGSFISFIFTIFCISKKERYSYIKLKKNETTTNEENV